MDHVYMFIVIVSLSSFISIYSAFERQPQKSLFWKIVIELTYSKRKTKISFLRILLRGCDKNLKEFEYLLHLPCERNKVMAW